MDSSTSQRGLQKYFFLKFIFLGKENNMPNLTVKCINMSFLNHQSSIFISPLQLQSRAFMDVVFEWLLSKVGLHRDIPIQAHSWVEN
jgi:hypothetical protein